MSNTLSQWAQLLYYVYAGALMGLIYDCLELFRTKSALLDAALDALFWTLCLITAVGALLDVSGYELRVSAIFCFALGIFAFKTTLSAYLGRIFSLFIRLACALVCGVSELLK